MDPTVALARLKKMVAWDTDPVLSEPDVIMLRDAFRTVDSDGRQIDEVGYVPTYALNRAATAGWEWKAGASVDRYKFVDESAEFNRHQVHQHCINMQRLYVQRGEPVSLRSQGAMAVDTSYTTIPWWWALAGN